jgi:hypothetical protein
MKADSVKRTYTVQLTIDYMKVISDALVELPFKVAAPVLEELNRQVYEQSRAVANAEKEEVRKE